MTPIMTTTSSSSTTLVSRSHQVTPTSLNQFMPDASASSACAANANPTALSMDSNGEMASAFAGLAAHLRMIEENQDRLAEDLQAVKAQLVRHHNGKGREETLIEEAEPVDLAKAVEELTKKVDGLASTVKLDQQRLYARLMNSNITMKKQPLMPVIGTNGKPPQNFSATKGEFEHITKERYEEFLKAYGLPLKGDTNAKREAVREFIGLTPLQ